MSIVAATPYKRALFLSGLHQKFPEAILMTNETYDNRETAEITVKIFSSSKKLIKAC